MSKSIKNFVVHCRRGGDIRRWSHNLIVGAKSEKEAIAFAKADNGSHHHYSCTYAQSNPRLLLKYKQVVKPDYPDSEPYVEINGQIYIKTEETRETWSAMNKEQTEFYGEHEFDNRQLTLERKYVKRYARKASDVLWVSEWDYKGEEQIQIYYNYKG